MAKSNTAPKKSTGLDEIEEIDLAKSKVVGRGLRKHRKLPLRAIREAVGKTQLDIAELASMNQGDISKLEQREDFRLSTLRRYISALGGEVELVVVLATGRRITLEI